jgi:hypothetical protein
MDKTIIAKSGKGVEYAGLIPGTKTGIAGFPSASNSLPTSSPSAPGLINVLLLVLCMLVILLALRF